MDWGIFELIVVIVWVGCFAVVATDSANRGISPWFWRIGGLFGGPFALLAYGLVRELRDKKAGSEKA